MLPPEEIRMLETTVRDAWRAAAEGRVAEGYAILDVGLLWAETPATDPLTLEPSLPEPWSEHLTRLYQAALMRYVTEFPAASLAAFTEELIGEAREAPGGVEARLPVLCPRGMALCEKARALQDQAAQLRAKAALHRRRAEAARQRCAERRRKAAELTRGRGERSLSPTAA